MHVDMDTAPPHICKIHKYKPYEFYVLKYSIRGQDTYQKMGGERELTIHSKNEL